MQRIILHVDMDAFFASVEVMDNPRLSGKPLIIGALPGERGVVSTCSYEARKYGVHSAMNIKKAYQLCPSGIYMHPNYEKYKEISNKLHSIWCTYTDCLESIALDEAFLDITNNFKDFNEARKIAFEIKRRIKQELNLSCSVGLAYSKSAAKIASEEKKPDGYFEITSEKDFVNLIIDRDVRTLYSVGKMTAEKLKKYGIKTVRDVRKNSEKVIDILGKSGRFIVNLSSGIDERKVIPHEPKDAKSISREITFQQDVDNVTFLKDVLFLLSICVEKRAKRLGLYGNGVTLKVTYADMKSITRSKNIPSSNDYLKIYVEAKKILLKIKRSPVRLLGVGLYNLSEKYMEQLSFFDTLADNKVKSEGAKKRLLLAVAKKYGVTLLPYLDKTHLKGNLYETIEKMRSKL